jgi:hypothetical protein
VRIVATAVFEGVVYQSFPADVSNPCRPVLEVDAVLRAGDADATSGPLLLPVAEYIAMVGLETAKPCLEEMAARGRIVERLDVEHLVFPTWTPLPPP